ncbi:MAG: nucleotidyltransferase family protein [Chloroflexi bacterium]|nr:nucleotidyltransferase family protein [Chloroflexota bacterium]
MDAAALARWLLFPERNGAPESVRASPADALTAADEHGLLPLWHYRARQGVASMPSEGAQAASDAYYVSLARAGHYYRELALVQASARAIGVPLLALKGAHVAAALYPQIATRPMVDLDLLTPRAAVEPLIAALAPHGLRELERDARVGHAREYEIQTLLVRSGERPYSRVALHWDLFDYPFYESKFPIGAACARAPSRNLAGVESLVMADEDLLVYLSAHAALHHQFSRVLWLCDIALLLDAYAERLDWDRSLALMTAADLLLPCRATLERVCADFGIELPRGVDKMLAAQTATPAARAAWRELSNPGRGAGRRFIGDWGAMRGLRRRLAFAAAQLLPSVSYMRHRYGVRSARGLPLAYLRRWLRGIATLRRVAGPK